MSLSKNDITFVVIDFVRKKPNEKQLLQWWRYKINELLPKNRRLNNRELARKFKLVYGMKSSKFNNLVFYEYKNEDRLENNGRRSNPQIESTSVNNPSIN